MTAAPASSSLKMTYCGSLCEAGDLGFTVDALLKLQKSDIIKLDPETTTSELAAI